MPEPLFAVPEKPQKNVRPLKATAQSDYSEDITRLSRRVRILEERNTNTQNRVSIIEQNMLSRHKQLNTELRTLLSEVNEIRSEIVQLKDRMLLIVKELQMSAQKEEVDVLKKYLELWDPMRFVTRGELDEVIKNRKL